MQTTRCVFFISDSTGITAETVGNGLLTQFETIHFIKSTLSMVDNLTKVEQALAKITLASQASTQPPLIFLTITDPQIHKALVEQAPGVIIDLFTPLIERLQTELGCQASHRVGQSHGLQNYHHYMQRINAVNYALANDDGIVGADYAKADCILLGVSRCGKTPTSLYLAMQFGLFVANYPFTEEDMPQPKLPTSLTPYRKKLFGLTIEPHRLCQVRQERREHSRYASFAQCQYEVQQMETFFFKEKIPYINTTTRSIEEIAAELIAIGEIQRH
jgi:[pyruvate, water dikinase]-phosphate phosphotransferase / [pyruvate, water dikinase] kinase